MSSLVFALGLGLCAVGGLGLYASIDLLGTELGALYAGGGIVALSCGAIIVAIAALIRRVDAAGAKLVNFAALAQTAANAPMLARAVEISAPDPAPLIEPVISAAPLEPAAEPEPAPVRRYSADGANYTIYSDGSLSTETPEGLFRFASMSDLKAHLAQKAR